MDADPLREELKVLLVRAALTGEDPGLITAWGLGEFDSVTTDYERQELVRLWGAITEKVILE